MDVFADDLLNKDRIFDINLPRVTSREVLEDMEILEPRVSPLEEELEKIMEEEERQDVRTELTQDTEIENVKKKKKKDRKKRQRSRSLDKAEKKKRKKAKKLKKQLKKSKRERMKREGKQKTDKSENINSNDPMARLAGLKSKDVKKGSDEYWYLLRKEAGL